VLRRPVRGDLISPEVALVRAFHRGEIEPGDTALDVALGLPPRRPTGQPFEDLALTERHPGESFADLPTPYPVARGLFEMLALGADDVLLDLGCAEGRVILYGAVVTQARFVGIEIVEERASIARAAAAALGLADRVEVLRANVLDAALERGTVFYLFRPFGEETERRVLARLHQEGRARAITVVTHRIAPGQMDPEVFEPVATGLLQFHRSRSRRPVDDGR
jgi:hypothetical protein